MRQLRLFPALADTARLMGSQREAFGQRIDAVQSMTRERLLVSTFSTVKDFMPRLLGSFCAMHPAMDVGLQVLNREGVVARL